MQSFSCSVCFTEDMRLTMIQGTIICKQCLEKAVETHKKNKDTQLGEVVENMQMRENRDIYD